MPKIDQGSQPRTGGTAYAETPAQVAAWKQLRSYMREQGIGTPGDTFTVQGTIAKMLLDGPDSAPRYFTEKQTNDKGEEKDWPFVKVLAAITDPRFGAPGTLDFPAKKVGASFFDGQTKRGRSPNRGGMYNLHVAVTGQEPSQALKDGHGDWDTEDYENKPILLRLVYQGKEDPDSQYADRRLGMKIFIAGFEKDRSVHRSTDLDDDDEDAPFPTLATAAASASPGRTPGASSPSPAGTAVPEDDNGPFPPAGSSATIAAAKSSAPTTFATPGANAARDAADLSVLPATDRQVAFIYALGREAGMGKPEVAGFTEGLFDSEPELLTRKQASDTIDHLQRKRYDEDPKLAAHPGNVDPRTEGTDELVSVGVSKKPAPPEDDEDLNF